MTEATPREPGCLWNARLAPRIIGTVSEGEQSKVAQTCSDKSAAFDFKGRTAEYCAGGAYMLVFGMCAIKAAGPQSTRS